MRTKELTQPQVDLLKKAVDSVGRSLDDMIAGINHNSDIKYILPLETKQRSAEAKAENKESQP